MKVLLIQDFTPLLSHCTFELIAHFSLGGNTTCWAVLSPKMSSLQSWETALLQPGKQVQVAGKWLVWEDLFTMVNLMSACECSSIRLSPIKREKYSSQYVKWKQTKGRQNDSAEQTVSAGFRKMRDSVTKSRREGGSRRDTVKQDKTRICWTAGVRKSQSFCENDSGDD